MTLPGTLLRGFPEGVRSSQRLLTGPSYPEVLSLHELGYDFLFDKPLSTAGPQFLYM